MPNVIRECPESHPHMLYVNHVCVKSAGQNDSFAPVHSGISSAGCVALGAGSELVVLVLEQDVERGE